ncbi:hypothetical protein KBX71_22670 [Micromonospora sp. D93]|uniref:hypothetical protein n=1 Tax=Micromonospora sp. D93 TaxID=2824886 RepID=UPI001B393735|nr:hypothetical protein [Micromonospora sp. D93]MBQ1020660.1 hypothetical protein [Micromonospora sp. D93]
MSTPLISALAALFGVILGQLLSRSNEYNKWLRTEQHLACSRLLEASETLHMQQTMEVNTQRFVQQKFDELVQALPASTRAVIREHADIASGRPLEEEEFNALLPQVQRILRGNPDLPASLRSKLDESLGREGKTTLTDLAAAAERLRAALESVRLVCPTKIIKKAEVLVLVSVELSASDDSSWKVISRRFDACRSEFVTEVRRRLMGRRRFQK